MSWSRWSSGGTSSCSACGCRASHPAEGPGRPLGGPETWGTKKTPFIQHAHDTHPRVDGKAVEITRESPIPAKVTVSPFKFINHSNEKFYRGIAEGIDPNIKVEFVYKDAS